MAFWRADTSVIRQLAEQTLFALKNTRNGPSEFNAILKQNSAPMLRRWAAVWIGKIGIESAQAVLEEVSTSDSDPGVRTGCNRGPCFTEGRDTPIKESRGCKIMRMSREPKGSDNNATRLNCSFVRPLPL
jgi:hypothetical protein